MKKCENEACTNDSDFIDSCDNYICEDCMGEDLSNHYTDQSPEDYDSLNWDSYPKNGYSE